jgi:putative heme iron utilization protein
MSEKKSEKKSEAIDSKISDRICKHMNRDHAESVLTYAQRYGNQAEATAATLRAIDHTGMDLSAEVDGATLPVRIAFDHELKDAADAHTTLVAMLKAP